MPTSSPSTHAPLPSSSSLSFLSIQNLRSTIKHRSAIDLLLSTAFEMDRLEDYFHLVKFLLFHFNNDNGNSNSNNTAVNFLHPWQRFSATVAMQTCIQTYLVAMKEWHLRLERQSSSSTLSTSSSSLFLSHLKCFFVKATNDFQSTVNMTMAMLTTKLVGNEQDRIVALIIKLKQQQENDTASAALTILTGCDSLIYYLTWYARITHLTSEYRYMMHSNYGQTVTMQQQQLVQKSNEESSQPQQKSSSASLSMIYKVNSMGIVIHSQLYYSKAFRIATAHLDTLQNMYFNEEEEELKDHHTHYNELLDAVLGNGSTSNSNQLVYNPMDLVTFIAKINELQTYMYKYWIILNERVKVKTMETLVATSSTTRSTKLVVDEQEEEEANNQQVKELKAMINKLKATKRMLGTVVVCKSLVLYYLTVIKQVAKCTNYWYVIKLLVL